MDYKVTGIAPSTTNVLTVSSYQVSLTAFHILKNENVFNKQ